MSDPYDDLLRSKLAEAPSQGFRIAPEAIHSQLLPHQRDIVQWAVDGGRRAIFAAFGLGKSLIQLEAVRLTASTTDRPGLIVCPLGVRQEFRRDAEMIGISTRFVRHDHEVGDAEPGTITGDPWGRVRKAIKVGQELRDLGAVPFMPQLSVLHEMIEPLSHAKWLRDDLEILSRCDGLVRLPGDSVGADREVDEARQLGLPIYFAGGGNALLDDFMALVKELIA